MFPSEPPVATPPPPPAHGGATAATIVVAVKAEKLISKSGLAWALTHAVRPGDSITLLALVSAKTTGGRRFWGFPRRKGDGRSGAAEVPDRICRISESCSQMVLQVQDQIRVTVRIKVVSVISAGAVTAESKSNSAHWVILDKKLKREIKHCMNELNCNIVVMKGSHAKIIRLNLAHSDDHQMPFYSDASPTVKDTEKLHSYNMKHTTPASSPENPSTSYTITSGENSLSSPDGGTSIFVVYEQNPLYEGLKKGKQHPLSSPNTIDHLRERAISFSANRESAASRQEKVFWIAQNHTVDEKDLASGNCNIISKIAYTTRTKMDNSTLELNQIGGGDYAFNSDIRDAVSLSRTSSTPPPLCSRCQFKAPVFGKPPTQFQYEELDDATDGFSGTNFVAEGEFGLVHRGVLRNGLIIAVKQLKFAGPQSDTDFLREVRVLSCAQHRNVELLIGFCIEGKKRLLVYEYICNNSLDFHLHGNEMPLLDWRARLKIAIGTARGLRYLHEDCRVGCIIHTNLQPDNILLTHDFEPLVADFGLSRLHSEWKSHDRNPIIGTSWYLAPEYFNGGKMTEKVDVYAFGLVLLELITGQRAHDLQHRMEHQFLLDNIHTLATLEPIHILAHSHQLLDRRLASFQQEGLPYELRSMGFAASLCLQQDPDHRPPMSKVVKMLEGGRSANPLAMQLDSNGFGSGRMQGINSDALSKRMHYRRLSY